MPTCLAHKFVSALHACTQGLVDVDLCGNSISVEGAKALAQGITASTSLAAVALDNNDLREEGARALLQVGVSTQTRIRTHTHTHTRTHTRTRGTHSRASVGQVRSWTLLMCVFSVCMVMQAATSNQGLVLLRMDNTNCSPEVGAHALLHACLNAWSQPYAVLHAQRI